MINPCQQGKDVQDGSALKTAGPEGEITAGICNIVPHGCQLKMSCICGLFCIWLNF